LRREVDRINRIDTRKERVKSVLLGEKRLFAFPILLIL